MSTVIAGLKSYGRHNCDGTHRTYRGLAGCIFRSEDPYWIAGEGPYAVLCWCGGLTISLHELLHTAIVTRHDLDRTGCGGGCDRNHEVVAIRPSLGLTSVRKTAPNREENRSMSTGTEWNNPQEGDRAHGCLEIAEEILTPIDGYDDDRDTAAAQANALIGIGYALLDIRELLLRSIGADQ